MRTKPTTATKTPVPEEMYEEQKSLESLCELEKVEVWSLESLCELEKQTKLLINLPEEKYEEQKSLESLCELEK